MKYGESSFDIIYLLFAAVSGVYMLAHGKNSAGRLMGLAAFILGAGDAFHLVPRVLNYFFDGDFSFWLGTGKLITSITMTVFYVLLYYLHRRLYNRRPGKKMSIPVYALAAGRILICLFPQNGWFSNESNLFWAIWRNNNRIVFSDPQRAAHAEPRVAVRDPIVRVLPARRRGRGVCAAFGNADAAQDSMLHADDRRVFKIQRLLEAH